MSAQARQSHQVHQPIHVHEPALTPEPAENKSQAKLLTQRPELAHWPREHLVGFSVVLEALSFGVPLQLAAQAEGDVRKVANGRNAVADINREIRVLAALHTFEEVIVLTLVVGVEMDFIGAD